MNEGGDFDKLGRGCIWDGTINPCIHQNHVFAVRPHSIRPSWLNVYTSSAQANSYFISRSKQSTNLASISSSNLMDLLVPIAPDSETEEILDFLNRETAKIDALIAEQQCLIELLQEKRQAVISHAVTKGLNQDAPMKDSGVEWLGEVPEHWEVKPLKYLVTLASGGTPSKENLAYWDGSIPWASSKDLKADELFDTQDHISQKAIDDGVATLIPAGSILTVVRGMILRHTFPVAITRVPMAINQDLKVIRPSGQVTSGYLAWLLSGSSGEVLSRVDEAGHGTKVLRIDWWLTMMVPVPPVAEQKLIAESLIKHLQEIVALTDEAHRGVSVLQERRSALISAAVTGQIDVRGFVPEVEAA
jgi:type I restriction enzyme S subunit